MFLPTTKQELDALGWDRLDVILVTGDSYIDSPFIGIAVIGKMLARAGFRVGVIAQPDTHSAADITRLGEPRLFWGVSGGCIDSMIANYTSLKKKRRSDDYTPGGRNTRRPDRAAIVYTNLIRQHFKNTAPIVLGGLEASLRRVAHYDYWDDRVRGSILFDAKADYLLYGMAEKATVELARTLNQVGDVRQIRGLCYIAGEADTAAVRKNYLELPPLDLVEEDKEAFTEMFYAFYQNNDPITARGLYQKHGNRYLVQNPPQPSMSQLELDAVFGLGFERAQHPYYETLGKVKALETIKFSILSHRGCYGECNFCAIAVHEGRTVQWRSEQSILAEARELTKYPDFTGFIRDVGGPTANMYGFECGQKLERGACPAKRCLYPEVCPSLEVDHSRQVSLLKKLRKIEGIKKVFVASGVRPDLVLADRQHGEPYLKEVVGHHISGQMKVAPEHSEDSVLRLMGKPPAASTLKFKSFFDKLSANAGKKQFLTYYLIAAHPGCTAADMKHLKSFADRNLHLNPEQVQIFLPAPSTYSSLMYYTGINPFTGKPIFVEKEPQLKNLQKDIIIEPAEDKTLGKRTQRTETNRMVAKRRPRRP
ncbi:YgiQ family radical SAM protein [Dehalogenimonas alkenigignens]|uniref:Putative radical SAM protein YgiQ n=1 Tax=Dehalogenimonas alkenigignens TaxID=1217799 RepID=A0A0W0GJK0_9CHLR|nr:YgiQ family radical SAM protein [Dehalogenimonas alkenigignens]KTB48735.1 putative radical SAM protein YgiQ [Dehalogenimonas alkenigignens]PVV84850.1 YgiQ family radical SAM protein [Dehalogenimonas alkenigignens]